MRKLACAVLLSLLVASGNEVFGQKMTSKEVTEYICGHKWFLRRYEQKEQYYTVPKEYQGTFMVFLPSGKVYYYKNGENADDKPRYDWKLSGDKITITTHEDIKGTFKFELTDFIGYKIYITELSGEYKDLKYVWEEREKLN